MRTWRHVSGHALQDLVKGFGRQLDEHRGHFESRLAARDQAEKERLRAHMEAPVSISSDAHGSENVSDEESENT